jgi:predicted RNA-binding protein with PIN domain
LSGAAQVVDGLVGLDARAWAQLLRALRVHPELPAVIATALERPTSDLASGSARQELCEAIAAATTILDALRADTALPAAVHVALGAAEGGQQVTEDTGIGPGPDASASASRASERARDLRRALEEERRRREGAEARAASAEARADAAIVERDELWARVVALEQDVAASQEAVEQAAARAERRSGSRLSTLEQELAAERRTLESLRRAHERAKVDLVALREEVEQLRARDGSRVPAPVAASAGSRPLVLPEALDEATTDAARWIAARAGLLLVDGYNVTLTLRPSQPLEEQRRWLVERLRPLAARGGIRPVVIFDGDGATGRMRDTGGVEVRFTTGSTIADDEIVFAVAATDEPVLVVTDDVELRARVQAEGGNVVGVVHLSGIIDG